LKKVLLMFGNLHFSGVVANLQKEVKFFSELFIGQAKWE